jgi:CheY-like chemotaxis protein
LRSPGSILYGRRVLVADDEAFSQSIVVRMVSEMGAADVLTASDGDEALRLLSPVGCNVTVAILDFNMPGADGLNVLKHIRMRKAGVRHDIHVVMLTGTSDHGLVGAAFALDVDAFVVKPVTKAIFGDRIDKVLSEYREIKSVSDYEKVDIERVSRGLIQMRPVAPTPPEPKKEEGPEILHLALNEVPAGAILAVNIFGPTGELLLSKDSVLSDRFLRRLKELQGLIGLQTIAIYAPKGNGSR